MVSDKGFAIRRRCGGIDRAANPPIDQPDQNRVGRLLRGGAAAPAPISSRKLAASLWRLSETTNGGGSLRWERGSFDRLGFQYTAEGNTKWDHCDSKERCDRVGYFHSSLVSTERKTRVILGLGSEKERGGTKRSIVKNLEDSVRREKERRRRIDTVNSELLRDISKAKSSAQKFMHNLVKEKKDRQFLEDICKELAKEIEGYKAEIRELKSQRGMIQEEAENERKIMQVAGVWREEQARMKLCNAKLILESKLAEMNTMIDEVKALLSESKLQRGGRVSNRSTISSTVVLKDKGIGGVKTARRNPHVVRAMEGHIEWPQGIKRSGPSAEKLLEAKFKSQKTITRNVLKRRGTSQCSLSTTIFLPVEKS